ncbi:MAG: SDR family NAD(P)-dependent oxidoreductase [Deltaproteobacteria bacterium]|nr:SDR family NAD(P)-dependent oxidoreductase [Deltaproteobacteria bacterium]MBW2361951.1 SDR family NAD(P)-dependent oxidoreductase [Deltaproteobacteria bacterium]
MSENSRPLEGKVALVTGASRGIGKGIALELGAAGATVYVTGRTRLDSAEVPDWAASIEQAGTIDAAATELTALGGEGIAAYCDHADDAQVEAVFQRIEKEQGRLDILVNNVCWNDLASMLGKPFWELPLSAWDETITVGLRSHYVASHFAAPTLVRQGSGLIVNVSSHGSQHGEFIISVPYLAGKAGIDRITDAMHHDLHKHGISVVSIWPGLVSTERLLSNAEQTEDGRIKVFGLDIGAAESPRLSGRCTVHLAADPEVASRSGRCFRTSALAHDYGFTDVDGTIPDDSHVASTVDGDAPEYWKTVLGTD